MASLRHWLHFMFSLLMLTTLTVSTKGAQVTESFNVYTNIRYRFASTKIISMIRNTEDSASNVDFSVALPRGAFIVDFFMLTGGKTYKGTIRERTLISQINYNSKGGNSRQITASRDSNTFGVSMLVGANANANFTLVYTQMLRREHGIYEHQVLLNPGQAVHLLVEIFILENQDLTYLHVPLLRRPDQTLRGEDLEKDNSMARIFRPSDTTAHVIFVPTIEEQGPGGLAHLFSVKYDVVHSPNGDIIIVDGYFMHFFAPAKSTMPKDIIFVLDVSGSMHGNKLHQMKVAMNEILNDLQPRDRFNIVPFSSWAYGWMSSFVQANKKFKSEAKTFIGSLEARGGTNIYGGIMRARELFYSRTYTTAVSMIFFLTDGQDRANIPVDTSIAIYGIAFGDDADLEYIKALSSKNSGFSQKVYEDVDAASQVAEFYDKISNVSLTDVKFVYLPELVEAGTLTQTQFPTIFEGSEVVVMGKVKGNVTQFSSEIAALGQAGQVKLDNTPREVKSFVPKEELSQVMLTLNISSRLKEQAVTSFSTEKTWAFVTILEKLEEENKMATQKGETKNLEKILDLATKYKFVTPLTSVVVYDPDTGSQVMESAIQDKEENTQDNRAVNFIKARPPTTTEPPTTTTTTTTTTRMPWCPPKEPMGETLKSYFLTFTNASGLAETCLGSTPNSFRYLRRAMKSIRKLRGVPKRQEVNQTNSEEMHITEIVSLIVQASDQTVCLKPGKFLDKNSIYTLLQTPAGITMYLLTGWHWKRGKVIFDRLLFNTSSGEIATIFLGTTNVWRISGNGQWTSDIKGPNEMSLDIKDISITLQRFVGISIVYNITLNLSGSVQNGSYGGILAHSMKTSAKATNRRPHRGRSYTSACRPLAEGRLKLRRYKASPMNFIHFFLDFILDLRKNLPLDFYE